MCPPAKLGNVDHPPAAVAGDVDIEAGHGSLSDEAVGVFTHEHEIGKAPVQRFVRSYQSRGRCGRRDYSGGEYERNMSGMAHMRTLAEAKTGIELFRRTGSSYQAHGID